MNKYINKNIVIVEITNPLSAKNNIPKITINTPVIIFQIEESALLDKINAVTSIITPKTINIEPVITPIEVINVEGKQTKTIPITESIIPRTKLTI